MSNQYLAEFQSNINTGKYNSPKDVKAFIKANTPDLDDAGKKALFNEAKGMMLGFKNKLKNRVALVSGSDFEDVGPNTKKYFSGIISNPSLYDGSGNWTGGELKALSSDKAKTIQKLWTRLDNAEKIGRQQEKYEARGEQTFSETVGRSLVPDAYAEGKTGLEKWFAGGVNVLELGGRTAMAAKRAAMGETDFVASMQAEAGDKTTEESIVGGVVGSPGLGTAAKIGGRGVGKAANILSAGKSSKISRKLADKVKKSKVGGYYQEGKQLMDSPGTVQGVRDIETANIAPKKGDFKKKLFTSVARNLPREAAISGTYIGEAATNKDKSGVDVVTEMGGSAIGIFAGSLFDAYRNSAIKKHRASEAGALDVSSMPKGFDEEYFNEIRLGIQDGKYNSSADAIMEKFEKDALENIRSVDRGTGEILETILKAGGDNPESLTPIELISKARSDAHAKVKSQHRGDTTEKEMLAEIDKVLDLTLEGIEAKVKGANVFGATKNLRDAKKGLGKTKQEFAEDFGEEVEVTELSGERARKGSPSRTAYIKQGGEPVGNMKAVKDEGYEVGKADSFDEYLEGRGDEVDKRMNVREKQMGEHSANPTLEAAWRSRVQLDADLRKEEKSILKGGGDSRKYDLKDEARKSLEGSIEAELARVFPEGGEAYKRVKKLYAMKADAGIKNFFKPDGKIDKGKAKKFINKLMQESSDIKQMGDYTTNLKTYAKEAKELGDFLKKNKLSSPEFAQLQTKIDKLAKDQDKAIGALSSVYDEITAMKFIDKIIQNNKEAVRNRSGVAGIFERALANNKGKIDVEPITGTIKRILVNAPRTGKESAELIESKSGYIDDSEAPKAPMSKSQERAFIKENPMVSNSAWIRVADSLGKRGVSDSYKIPSPGLDNKQKKNLVKLLNNKNKGIFRVQQSGNDIVFKRIK